MADRLDRVQARLAKLEQRRLTIYRWRKQSVEQAQLAACHNRIGVALPPEVQAFLLHIGTGRGPVDDFVNPEFVDEWWDDPDDLLRIQRPFPFVEGRAVLPSEAPMGVPDGSVVIGDGGCEWFTVLAVTGPQVGTVWNNGYDHSCRYGFWPARETFHGALDLPPPPQPVDFLTWFETWIEDLDATTALPRWRLRLKGLA